MSTTTPATFDGGTAGAGEAGPGRTKDELIRRIDEAWIPFRLAAAAAGIRALDTATPFSWTFKQMLAHVAAWHELTARRFRRYRERGETELPSPDETVEIFDALGLRGPTREAVIAQWSADRFNAAVAESAKDRDANDVLRELDSSFKRVREELATLTDEQVAAHVRDGRSFVEAVLAGNTYGHYEEHHDEIHAAVPKTPARLLELVREGWRPFRTRIAHIGDRHLSDRTPAGWTYKGLLGHVAHWFELVIAELPVRLDGRRSPPPNVDAANARAAADAETRSAHEVLERLDNAYRAVVDAIAALPAEQEIPFTAVRLVAGETYDHFREHTPELEAARPRSAADLLARIDDVWRPFRAAIRDRGRAGLDAEIRPGWRCRDVVAHVAAWIEEYVRELRAGEFRAGWGTRESMQAFNERAIAERRLVGPEALVDELDTAHHALVAAVGALSSEEIARDDLFSACAFYTYLHWEEHLPDLAPHGAPGER